MERALILSGGGGRGAFQVGVLKYLNESNWVPDLICGTSIGAINAVGIGSGLTPVEMEHIWKIIDRKKMYRIAPAKFIRSLLGLGDFFPPADTGPLKSLLRDYMNIPALQESNTEIIITAVNMATARITYFNNRQINIEQLMASSAFPMIFPWQTIDGEPYWDGGIMDNTPILPALERKAKEIITVLLSPVGAFRMPIPQTPLKVAEMIMEQSLISTYHSITSSTGLSLVPGAVPHSKRENNHIGPIVDTPNIETPKVKRVAPEQMLGFKSLLTFSNTRTRCLIEYGYHCAKRQLGALE